MMKLIWLASIKYDYSRDGGIENNLIKETFNKDYLSRDEITLHAFRRNEAKRFQLRLVTKIIFFN